VINLTRFPVRRLDLIFNVTYQADLEKVRDILLDIAAKNPYVIDNPAPLFRVDKFERAGPGIIFNVWFDKNQILETRTSMYMAIQKRFAEENIEKKKKKVEIVDSKMYDKEVTRDFFKPEDFFKREDSIKANEQGV
jgi:small-conductance mechanosensitive channel